MSSSKLKNSAISTAFWVGTPLLAWGAVFAAALLIAGLSGVATVAAAIP